MNIVRFSKEYIEQAIKIAMANYRMERQFVPALPQEERLPLKNLLPDMEHFVKTGLGSAVVENHQLLGFCCGYEPIGDAFGTTGVRGTFSPIHGHGVATHIIGKDRDRMYSGLYQATAEKWVKAGIRSHAIALYTHDRAAVNSFFYNGFGLRCMDLIRSLEEELEPVRNPSVIKNVRYEELDREDWKSLLILHNGLLEHIGGSPVFMSFPKMDEEALYEHASEGTRYFVALIDREPLAYIKLGETGENFVTEHAGMMNICGAYCNPKYRGIGIYHNLLAYMIALLKKEGYQLLGVDCESFNPTARAFWTKYFAEYTHSVVRRIDEKAVDAAGCKSSQQ
jgi:GNAT superfamily N-acetyltransferase